VASCGVEPPLRFSTSAVHMVEYRVVVAVVIHVQKLILRSSCTLEGHRFMQQSVKDMAKMLTVLHLL
jgi:hypothetical protein